MDAAIGPASRARGGRKPGTWQGRERTVGVSPSGGMVYVTGYSSQSITSSRIATVAYNAATGAQMWVQLYKGPSGTLATASLAVSPQWGNGVRHRRKCRAHLGK